MFHFEKARFRYEPFPIGYTTDVLSTSDYQALSDSWPDFSLLLYKPELGHKYSLSEVNNPNHYHDFISKNSNWQRLHQYIKSPQFLTDTFAAISDNHINLGYGPTPLTPALKKIRNRITGRTTPQMSARWEFSMLPAHSHDAKDIDHQH